MANEREEKQKHDHGAKAIVDGKEVEKTKFQKALDLLVKQDASTIKDSIVSDYIEPNSKKFVNELDRKFREFISDTINSAVDLVLFGKTRDRDRDRTWNDGRRNYTAYYTYGDGYYGRSSRDPDERDRDPRYQQLPSNRVKKICIPSYGKAEEVLRDLNRYINTYQCTSIGDYYQLVGMSTCSTDFMYGWQDLVAANIIYDSGAGGYVIDFPKPIPLD